MAVNIMIPKLSIIQVMIHMYDYTRTLKYAMESLHSFLHEKEESTRVAGQSMLCTNDVNIASRIFSHLLSFD